MKANRPTPGRRRRRGALQLLAAELVVDERQSHAARIERLGRAMFGELWPADEPPAPIEPQAARLHPPNL